MNFLKKAVLLILLFQLVQSSGISEFDEYIEKIAGTDHFIKMMPVKGGEFVQGGTAKEGSREDEFPARTVEVGDFWMSSLEITWDQFEVFLYRETDTEILTDERQLELDIDGISGATMPYVNFNKPGLPVINITHYAASTFCKWLSAKTGHFYRLPTEAEWEYAARAGTATPYFFGGPENLDEFAWYGDNSDAKLHKGGQKTANPFGLYDVYGNAAEWVIDAYDPEFYTQGEKSRNPVNFPKKLYPRVVRGGSFKDTPEDLRSASRQYSVKKWKRRDPQIPKSLWWFTDATHVGFRIVRPKDIPPRSEWDKYWGKPIKEY